MKNRIFSYKEDADRLTKAGFLPTGATVAELDVFFEFCNTQKLNPYNKEAYLLPYYDKDTKMYKHTPVTYYKIIMRRAAETGHYAGISDVLFNRRGDGHGGYIYDTMAELIAAQKTPVTAHCTAYRITAGLRCPFEVSISVAEYVKVNKEGNAIRQWAAMFYTMLRKVVSSHAVSYAFPGETAGLKIAEEMAALQGETDAADALQDVSVTVRPKGMPAAPVENFPENPFPPTDAEAAERAEVLEQVAHVLDGCKDLETMSVVWRSNAANWKDDTEIVEMFKARKKAIIQAEKATTNE